MFLALVPIFAWALPWAPADPAPCASRDMPGLAEFAAPSALPGSEGWLLEELLALLPADVSIERDAFGSLIVRAAGGPCTRVIAVGLDEPGYVVGQIRDDGYLRLRFLGRTAAAGYHLAREGRPALVLPREALPGWTPDPPGRTRAPSADSPTPAAASAEPAAAGAEPAKAGAEPAKASAEPAKAGAAPGQERRASAPPAGRPGVVLVNSIHLRNPRPASLDEADLWLDVGADSAADVAGLGISLLDPVVVREVIGFADRVAGPELGRRAAAFALLAALRDVPRGEWREGLALAFVAQSVPGTGALGRGGEGLLRRLQPAEVLLLAARDGGEQGASRVAGPAHGGLRVAPSGETGGATPPVEPTWITLELRVQHAGTPVESVAEADLAAFGTALRAEVAR